MHEIPGSVVLFSFVHSEALPLGFDRKEHLFTIRKG